MSNFTQMNWPPSWTLGLWSAVKVSKGGREECHGAAAARAGPYYSTEQGDRGGGLAPQVRLGHSGAWVGFFCVGLRAQNKAEAKVGDRGDDSPFSSGLSASEEERTHNKHG